MENQPPDDFEMQVNNCGKRVFQMRREGRDQEYMINQLSYEGFSNEVIRRIMFAEQTQTKVEQKTVDKQTGNYFFWLAGINFFGVVVMLVVTFIVGFSIRMVAINVGGIISAVILLILGLVKKNS